LPTPLARLPPRPVEVRAHAKVNLDLRVLGVRPDGFHELRTVFQSIELHDVITCVPRKGPFAIRTRAAGVPLDESNLVWQAAAALWQELRREGELRDVAVTIEKRIPLESGLGGGSADGAAALTAFARLWAGGMSAAQLRDVAAGLGADVPFFLSGGTALGLGRGDEIYPLVDLPRHWIVLVLPPFGVSTREAYAWYDEERSAGYRGGREPQYLPGPLPSRAAQMINDLEAPIVRRHPEIGLMKALLREQGAHAASMSGSGSAVFGLFRSRREAAAAMAGVARPGWRVLLTRTLDRDEYGRRTRVRAGATRRPRRPPRRR
jgi:4-diphosphocytidyl-2-C-methyl-D-erythritol kinase